METLRNDTVVVITPRRIGFNGDILFDESGLGDEQGFGGSEEVVNGGDEGVHSDGALGFV